MLGLSPAGLYVLRELAAAGVPLLGVTDGLACGSFSRYLRTSHGAWTVRSPRDLLDRLMAYREEVSLPPVLIPISDRFIEFIAEHHEELKGQFIFQDSYAPETVGRIVDKKSFYELCEKHGVDYPDLWSWRGGEEYGKLAGMIRYPCIFKPSLIHKVRDC